MITIQGLNIAAKNKDLNFANFSNMTYLQKLYTLAVQLHREQDANKWKPILKNFVEIQKAHHTIKSVRSNLTNYRRDLRAFFSTELQDSRIKFWLSIGIDAQKEIEQSATRRIRKFHFEQNEIKRNDVQKIINTAKMLLSSNSYIRVGIGLMLLTGRRCAEIFKTAKFEHLGINNVSFDGQLKKKDAEVKPYGIPVLCDTNLVINGLNNLREMTAAKRGEKDFSMMETSKVNDVLSSDINKMVKKIFGAYLGENCKGHDLRKAYAAISSELYKPQNWTKNAFISAVLGHDENGINTASGYMYYTIID